MRRKRYTEAFKKQLIALVAQGRTPEQLSREYEPIAQTIRNWVREAQKLQPASELEKDRRIQKLEAENANQARIIAMNWDGHWKEYDGDYDAEITVEEVPDERTNI